MAMPKYDLLALIDSEMPEEGRGKVVDDVVKAITDTECELTESNDWGVKKLAYPINDRTDAQYHLFRLSGPGSAIGELGRKLRIMDGVLRFRTVRQPESSEREWVDFKSYETLRRTISDRAKIKSRRNARMSRRKMALTAKAIKQARELALLPYVVDR